MSYQQAIHLVQKGQLQQAKILLSGLPWSFILQIYWVLWGNYYKIGQEHTVPGFKPAHCNPII